jgi:hypothetical protein
MTTNSSNQQGQTPQQKGYNPVTLDDVQKHVQSSLRDYFGQLRDPMARCIAAPLLFFIFTFRRGEPLVVAPLTLLVLLGCLILRLDNHTRQIAAVPLALAAMKLAFQMVSLFDSTAQNALSTRSFSSDPGFIWLPMFFSICLAFIPRRDSVTFRIIVAGSCVLIASGLLPGQGFVVIFYLLDGTLFLALLVGIFVDLKSYMPVQVQNVARPTN